MGVGTDLCAVRCHRQTLSYSAFQRAVTMTRLMGIGLSRRPRRHPPCYELLKAKRVSGRCTFDRLVAVGARPLQRHSSTTRSPSTRWPRYAASAMAGSVAAFAAMFASPAWPTILQNLPGSTRRRRGSHRSRRCGELRRWLDASRLAVAFGGTTRRWCKSTHLPRLGDADPRPRGVHLCWCRNETRLRVGAHRGGFVRASGPRSWPGEPPGSSSRRGP